MKKNNKGFSLVELIVVIAIMAILAAIAIPTFAHFINKANEASDDELLHNINYIFQAACLENGVDVNEVTDADINYSQSKDEPIALESVTVNGTFDAALSADIVTSFNMHFDDMKNEKFIDKEITALYFDVDKHAFVTSNNGTVTVLYRGNEITVSTEQLEILKNSKLGKLGAETLLTEVGSAVDWANEFGLVDYAGSGFQSAYMRYVGINPEDYGGTDSDEFQAAWADAIEKLGGDEDQIMANAIALYAAENSANLKTEDISAWLGSDKSEDDFKENANSQTLSEAAAIYGLYMSYKGEEFNSQDGVLDVVVDALSDEDFATWVTKEEGKAELEAYKAAMGIINDAAVDGATGSLLENGFDDSKLIDSMSGLMGN